MVDYANIFKQFNQQPRNLLEAVEANRLKNQQEQARQLALRQQQNQTSFEEQSNPLKLVKLQFDNMSEQDKFVETELLQGSIELQPFLDAKDSQSVMQSLQMRRNKLAQAGLRTDEIDGAIQLAQQGNFDALKQLTQSQIKAGRMIGLLPNQERGGGTGVIMDRLMAQDPTLTEYDALLIVQGLGRQGLKPTGDGGVSEIGNYGNEKANIASNVAGATANAVLPAKQQEQVMRVDAEQQITTGKNQAELQQKDALKLQDLKQSLPIAENATAQAILSIDDTISKLENAKTKVGYNTAGFEGLLKIMPISDYNDLKVQLKTLNARMGLDSLISLKNKGSTLGQVAVKEFEALQDSISNLTQSQRPEQLKQNLDDAIRQTDRQRYRTTNPHSYYLSGSTISFILFLLFK
jgi:hypothetical protein